MKVNTDILNLRQSIEVMISMLAKRNVKVTQQGTQAKTEWDPQTNELLGITIPYLPDDADSETIQMVNGYADHEIGHVFDTDPIEVMRAHKESQLIGFLQNCIEDPRVEAAQAVRYRGSGYNIAVLAKGIINKVIRPNYHDALKSGSREQIAAALFVPMIRAMAGNADFQRFMDDENAWPHVQPLLDQLPRDFKHRVANASSTKESTDLAIELHSFMERPPEPPPPPPAPSQSPSQEDPPPPEDDDPSEDDGDGGSDEQSSEDPPDDAGQGGDDPSDDSGQGETPDEDQAGQDEPPAGGDPAAEDPDEDGQCASAAGDDDQGEAGDKGNVNAQESQPLDMPELMQELGKLPDYDSMMAEVVSARALKAAQNSDYLPYTVENDRVEEMWTTEAAVEAVSAMVDVVDEMAGPLTTELERVLVARSKSTWSAGHRTGRLNTGSIHRVVMGKEDVFRRKAVTQSKSVAVGLLVDSSGSMAGEKILTASYTAYLLGKLLERLNIKFETLAFTTRPQPDHVIAALKKDPHYGSFSRKSDALRIYVLKGFAERIDANVRARHTQIIVGKGVRDVNIDGESVMIAARRLLAQKVDRRVLIVKSDGRPAGRDASGLDMHLKAVVKAITKMGIEVYGIGIADDSVKSYYHDHSVIRSVKDLQGAVVGKLRDFLLRK